MGQLEGQVAIVTGGGRGIGKAISKRLAQEGAQVVVCDIDKKLAEEVAGEIKDQFKKETLALEVNVADITSVEEMASQTLSRFENTHILINNAGINRDTLLIRMSDEDWHKVIEVNLTGVFNCTKVVAKKMIKQRYGKMVNISSVIGIMGNAGQVNYAASKAGIIGLTKSIAKELASRNITVNAIAPGFIETEMTKVLSPEIKEELLKRIPLNRFGKPSDVAELALFLSTSASEYITGQVIVIDGGMIM
ncbi:3-oxoacyl-[acyl-carrier-protein] reductase [bacterium]|nr:3-oxoacyl-[acyl-carrier-protein] reductase [bacterium]MBU1154117.1 3-oxoacyl-[acyl-carrier-protein] reductase [bacterium]MBU1782094.1 3-oxoacyl-[acyl-carrier-protein] reductase [bacterium]MBU2599986.1 3-oxoacyl-[acyl-carrier-protein] reductase [bacterium]